MNIATEGPFFPTSVQWFEIPMTTVQAGLARLADDVPPEKVDIPGEAPAAATSDSTGRLLDQHA